MRSRHVLVLAAAAGAVVASLAGNVLAQQAGVITPSNPIAGTVPAWSVPGAQSLLTPVPTGPQNLGSFDIVISPGATLAGNAAALAAFNRAAAQWEARISDPITVTINADLASLGAGILGSTSSVTLQGSYTDVRNAVASDGIGEGHASITSALPTSAQFTATVPSGRALSGLLLGTKANLKALGFPGLDGAFGVSDASITFSTNFTFDLDNSNGVTAGQTDFETVASHEIGHALGFFSIVDSINGGTTSVSPNTLDLFRFADGVAGQDPASLSDFTTFPRNLVPGATDITDDTVTEYLMSTGLNNPLDVPVVFPGADGRQASHWKADELSGNFIGMMDPTLSTGVVQQLTEADFRAMDLIGYEVAPVPEPSSLALAGAGLAMLVRRRRRLA